MSLIDLNMLGLLLVELNDEIRYKLSERTPLPDDVQLLNLWSDGNNHKVYFRSEPIWDSALMKTYENLPPEKEIELTEKENFESYLRILIMDEINLIKDLQV